MQYIVNTMAHSKSYTSFDRDFAIERKMSRHVEIHEPRNHIAKCISYVDIHHKIQKVVQSIMNARGYNADYCKTYELPYFIHFVSLALILSFGSRTPHAMPQHELRNWLQNNAFLLQNGYMPAWFGV